LIQIAVILQQVLWNISIVIWLPHDHKHRDIGECGMLQCIRNASILLCLRTVFLSYITESVDQEEMKGLSFLKELMQT
jgi:hypothetical protein